MWGSEEHLGFITKNSSEIREAYGLDLHHCRGFGCSADLTLAARSLARSVASCSICASARQVHGAAGVRAGRLGRVAQAGAR